MYFQLRTFFATAISNASWNQEGGYSFSASRSMSASRGVRAPMFCS